MNLEIILVGILVGIANFASRFGPFFVIQKFQQGSQQRGSLWLKIALGSIGIAAISSMLVVATLPPLLETQIKALPCWLDLLCLQACISSLKKLSCYADCGTDLRLSLYLYTFSSLKLSQRQSK
jgi:hypothetical protein